MTMLNGEQAAPVRPVVWREMESATEINRILNDAEVFPAISVPGMESFDVSSLVVDPNFIFLRCDGGVLIFTPDLEPGFYEVHSNFLKEHRGAKALAAMLAALEWMFTHTPAVFLWTRVPANNPGAQAMIRRLEGIGVKLWFNRERAWPSKDGPQDVAYYALTIHDWMRDSPVLEPCGQWFHQRLEEEFKRVGHVHEQHADEPAHDRAVGAAVKMILGGQAMKGVILYNRWARAAGYQMILLVSEIPLVIDTGEAMLHIKNDDFKVIKVRNGSG